MIRRGPRWVGGSLASLVLAACGSSAFVCEEDAKCGLDGACEATGYCSFPDAACPSGRRYGEHAADFAGMCVDAGGETTGSTSTSGAGTTAPSSDAGPDTSTSALTTGPTSSSTTADATAAGSTTTGTGPTSGGEGSSTGAGLPGLCDDTEPLIVEEFPSLPVSPLHWYIWDQGSAVANIVTEHLELAVDLPDMAAPDAYWGLDGIDTVTSKGAVGFRVVEAPDPEQPTEVMIGIVSDVHHYRIVVGWGDVSAYYRETDVGSTSLAYIDHYPALHPWVRMRFDAVARTVRFEVSEDGSVWESFHEQEVLGEFDFESAKVEMMGGAWEGPLVSDAIWAIDDMFVCGF